MMQFPDPPAWGLAVGALGKGLIFAAVVLFLASAILAKRPRLSSGAFVGGVAAIFASFAVHITLLMTRQYQFAYVWENTRNDMPEVYRFSAAWAAQEGSFLLWIVTSSAFAAIVARKAGAYRSAFTVICALFLAAMAAILAYESSFEIIKLSAADQQLLSPGQTIIMPPDGRGLNPTLMNYWMVIHPWVIFIGFGSLLSLFSLAASASITKNHVDWISITRPFAIFSMIVLGVGLTMGGLWAYETLGWGGFWAWDPVENVSLVPFLAAAVLVHGLFLQQRRGAWARLNILLGLLPFVWFVYGTYLTRSGALGAGVSVHSFAEMNAGARGTLLAMVIASAVALLAFTVRAFAAGTHSAERKVRGQRSLGMTVGMGLLYGIALMAAYGMSLPFIGTILGRQKEVVAEGDYNFVVAFPFVPALILMAIVPFIGWTKTASERLKTLGNIFLVSVILFGLSTFILVKTGLTLDGIERLPAKQLIVFYILVYVCTFAIIANGYRTTERIRSKSSGFGAFVTHAGVSMLLLGLIVSRAFEKTDFDGVTLTQPGRLALLPDRTYLASIEKLPSPEQLSDPENRLEFLVKNVSKASDITFRPNFYYEVEGGKPQPISRPDILRRPLYDLYFVVGAPETEIESDIELKVGEKKAVGQFLIEYLRKTQQGEPGQPGTKFGAQVKLTIAGKTYSAHPQMEITEEGPRMLAAEIPELGVSIELKRLMATDGSATLSVVSPELIFPVQLFFKPMTILVWLGAGVMTVGGILSIYQVSRKR